MAEENKIEEFSVDLLRVYYGRLFPYDTMYNWLSYGTGASNSQNQDVEENLFRKREWSFTIEDDIYIRYQSFNNKNEFMNAIQKRQPHKIDIGAVFSLPPKDHSTVDPEKFEPRQRELVFDIDMTDYDNIRTCCSGANICPKCWPYMTMAINVLDITLRSDFGFKNILWIYSGRRGVHCWVCDNHARELSNDARGAIIHYFEVDTTTTEKAYKSNKSPFEEGLKKGNKIHPFIRRTYSILEPMFEKYIIPESGQGLLATRERYQEVLKLMPHEKTRTDLYEQFESNKKMTSFDRWQYIKQATSISTTTNSTTTTNGGFNTNKKKKVDYSDLIKLESWRMEFVYTHTYPRLDANVSIAQNHLLKSPFCIHPKTGRVCIPIDPALAEEFNPFTVPTLRQLCKELDDYDREHKVVKTNTATTNETNSTLMDIETTTTNENDPVNTQNQNQNQNQLKEMKKEMNEEDVDSLPDYEKTSLLPALKLFHKTFMNNMKSTIRRTAREEASKAVGLVW